MDGTLDAPGSPGSNESSAFHRSVHPEDSVSNDRGGERWYDPWPVKAMVFLLISILGLALTGGTWVVSQAVETKTKTALHDDQIQSLRGDVKDIKDGVRRIEDKIDTRGGGK